jgi:hypothetical protein
MTTASLAKKKQPVAAKVKREKDSIYVERNLRPIRQHAGIPRSAQGVILSSYVKDTEPILELGLAMAGARTQECHRKTIKTAHILAAFTELLGEEGMKLLKLDEAGLDALPAPESGEDED